MKPNTTQAILNSGNISQHEDPTNLARSYIMYQIGELIQ